MIHNSHVHTATFHKYISKIISFVCTYNRSNKITVQFHLTKNNNFETFYIFLFYNTNNTKENK